MKKSQYINDASKIFDKEDRKTKILFFSDKDGTTNMTKEGKLVDALREINRNHGMYVLASGRTGMDCVAELEKTGANREEGTLPKYVGCDNGAAIIRTDTQEIVFQTALLPEDTKKIIGMYLKMGGKPEGIRATNIDKIMAEKSSPDAMEYYKGKQRLLNAVDDLASYLMGDEVENLNKITLTVSEEQKIILKEKLEKMGFYVDYGKSSFLSQHGKKDKWILDIQKTSKAAIANFFLQEIHPDTIVVMGNSYNDVELMKKVIDSNVKNKIIMLVTNPSDKEEKKVNRDNAKITKVIYEDLKEFGKDKDAHILLIPPNPQLVNNVLKELTEGKTLNKDKTFPGKVQLMDEEER